MPPLDPPPAVGAILGWAGFVERMCQVESALALAGADVGLWDGAVARQVADACSVDRLDLDELATAAGAAATPVIPLVRALSVDLDEQARAVLHYGATSQDIIDTAVVLQAREVMALVLDDLGSIGAACAELAATHRSTAMVGRTLLQQAAPTTFGAKAAHWLAGVTRSVNRVRSARTGLPAQLGGAVGTLSAYGEHGMAVAEAFAQRLGLSAPRLPWHTDRDVLGDAVMALALCATTLGKIARDIVLLAQSEVAEVALRGSGGSTAMPHKQNPVDPVMALASAQLCSGAVSTFLAISIQPHERGAGDWQAEWQAVPDVLAHAAAASSRIRRTVFSLEVDEARMGHNLVGSRGLVMSEALAMELTRLVGRDGADRITAALIDEVRDGPSLTIAAQSHAEVTAHLSQSEIEELLAPATYLGAAHELIDRALADWQEVS